MTFSCLTKGIEIVWESRRASVQFIVRIRRHLAALLPVRLSYREGSHDVWSLACRGQLRTQQWPG